jgi:hypothetical protein
MKDTLELMNLMREAKLLERDLTPDEEKRREEIAKDLPDDDFKKRYGDQWMQVKMATATNMVKKEELDLNERMRMPRQLIDTNKEVMIVKKNKVIVIDKKDQDKYMKKGWELAEEVGLNEGTIDKVKEIVSKKQAMKIDGVMVDSFTASAISQIYDKVNDANKKKMDKLPITKLANLAMKMMQKNEFVPEEVELDEGFKKGDKVTVKVAKSSDREIQQLSKKFGDTVSGVVMGQSGKILMVKTDKGQINPPVKDVMKEEVDLDEGTKQVLAHGGKGKYKVTKDGDKIDITFGGKVVGTADFDRGADSFFVSIKGEKGQKSFDDAQAIADYFAKNKITEEVEIEESKTTVPMSTKAGQSVKKGQVPKGMYGNAARDARRAMGRDPEMKQRAFSKDDSATDDDVKGASKNIMMQMRKAQSLKGKFDVEFQDGKKVKIPAKMAIAVQQKYNSMRKPADKEKFQAKIGKSYRDMLNALKEEAVSPAQQAAIAISKKERGEKPKKESILDRIDRKIKENKNG